MTASTPYQPQAVSFPSWMPQSNQFKELASMYKNAEPDFNTNLGEARGRMENVGANNLASGQAASAAAARAAQNRAAQNGGAVAASFGQGSLNLANYRQNGRMMNDFEQNGLAARQNMMGMKMQAAQGLGQGRMQMAGLQNDFYGNQQRNALASRGLDQDQSRIDNQNSQFKSSLTWDQNKFGQQMAFNQQDQRLAALQAALKNTQMPTGSWSTDNNGMVQSGQDSYNAYHNATTNRQNMVNQMQRLGSGFSSRL